MQILSCQRPVSRSGSWSRRFMGYELLSDTSCYFPLRGSSLWLPSWLTLPSVHTAVFPPLGTNLAFQGPHSSGKQGLFVSMFHPANVFGKPSVCLALARC